MHSMHSALCIIPNSQTIRPQKFLTLTPISNFIKRRVFRMKNLIIKNYLRNIYLLVRKHLMIPLWRNEKYTYKVRYKSSYDFEKTIAVLQNDSTAFLTKIITTFACPVASNILSNLSFEFPTWYSNPKRVSKRLRNRQYPKGD